MPNPFEVDVDVEAGAATPASQAGDYFGDGRNSTPHQQTRTPFDPRTVGQVRFAQPPTNIEIGLEIQHL
jgi:hypothetical protein